MNIIIIWKDSHWILKSHIIATYKPYEWLCIDLSELYTRRCYQRQRVSKLVGMMRVAWGRKAPRVKHPSAGRVSCICGCWPSVLSGLSLMLHCRCQWTCCLSLELGSKLCEERNLVIFIFISLAWSQRRANQCAMNFLNEWKPVITF